MPLFQQRKPKRFNYKSRLEKENDPSKESFQDKWQSVRGEGRGRQRKLSSLSILVLLFIMVLLLMYILKSYE